jgi:hypothetical protein
LCKVKQPSPFCNGEFGIPSKKRGSHSIME